MSERDPIEIVAEVIGGRDYDYEQRDQARRVVSAIRTDFELRRGLWLALTTDNPLSRLTKAPSSPVETTGGLLGHCPACHSPMYGPCGTCISKANAAGTTYEVKRLNTTIGRLGVVISEQVDVIAERDATIERLWAQLNEATNVPDERLQLPNCGDRP
jgi:hypothetical protein